MNFLSLVFLTLTSQVPLPAFNPSVNWRTTETEHFYIHFDSRDEESAARLVQHIEPVYQKITKNFQWEPATKTHVVLCDFTDESNGLSTPLPYNAIYLYAAPPTDGSPLDFYDDWLKTLITHEFTHTVHLDMAEGLNKIPRSTLGRIWIPNGLQQQWAIEGLAMFEETAETTKGRGRSPYIKMFLRTVSKENNFTGIDRATYWNDRYPYGNSAYWYGIGFHQYLAEKFNEKKIFDFAHTNASSLVPSFHNFKTAKVFGKSFNRLWDEWRIEEQNEWKKFAGSTVSNLDSKNFSKALKDNLQIVGKPTFNDLGDELYFTAFEKGEPKAFVYKLKDQKLEPLGFSGAGNRLFYSDGKLYYTKLSSAPSNVQLYSYFNDLWVFDLEKKKEKRLTRGLRLRDPIVYKNNVYGVRINHIKSSLIRFPLPKDQKDPFTFEVLYSAEGFNVISKPSISPDGSKLVFSMKVENKNRDLYLLDLQSKHLQNLTNDTYEDHEPLFSKSADEIYFSSARPMGTSGTIVPNIFSLHLATGKISQISDALTGTSLFALSDSNLAFGYFRSTGFEPRLARLQDFERKQMETLASSEATTEPTPAPAIKTLSTRPYSVGNTLLPRYFLPFFFYTESNTALGGLVGSRDPLNFHAWSAIGYQLFGPNRPGGALTYVYRGLPIVTLSAGGYATIADYGNILVSTLNSQVHRYYERDYGGYLSYSLPLYWNHQPSHFSFGQSLFWEKRSSLLKPPAGVRSGRGTATYSNGLTVNNIAFSPEEGRQWGVSTGLTWSSGIAQSLEGFSPQGSSISLKVDYSPKKWGSDFKILATTLSLKTFHEITYGHSIAFSGAFGQQWFDPLYQRTYQLGGSLGESPVSSVSKRTYPLRGLDASFYKGEGLIQGSLEYRYLLFKSLPGFGTAPIWFKNLHSALFADGGQTYDWKTSPTLVQPIVHKFSMDRFTLTGGAELRSDISVSYAPPLTFRLGYGYVFYQAGENVIKRKVNQTYFQIGSSF